MLATVWGLSVCGTIRNVRSTVLIVDDHAGFRASAARSSQADGFDVVGEAADGAPHWKQWRH